MSSDVRKTHKLSPDGKTLIPKKKRYDACVEQKQRTPRKKFRGVPADKREFRG